MYSQNIPKDFPRYIQSIPKVFQKYSQIIPQVFSEYSQCILYVYQKYVYQYHQNNTKKPAKNINIKKTLKKHSNKLNKTQKNWVQDRSRGCF